MILWDPDVLARIRRLALQARHAVEGVLKGAHRSRALGPEVEFVDFKEYAPGDPLRDLDWRILARNDRLVVRRYQAESDLPVTLVVDASGDLGTGTPAGTLPPLDQGKFGYVVRLTATVAWYLFLRQEPVGLQILGGDGAPWTRLPPRTGRRQLAAILAALASVRPGGEARIGHHVARMAPGLRRASLVVLVSDLMEEVGTWAPALEALGRRRTDTRILHVTDPAELDLRFPRTVRFFSPEGGADLAVDPGAVRPAFRTVVADWLAEVRREGGRRRVVVVPAPVDRPLADPLRRLLEGHTPPAVRGGA